MMRPASIVERPRSRPAVVGRRYGSRISIGLERLDYRQLEPGSWMPQTSWPNNRSEYRIRGKLHEGRRRICSAPERISESLVAAIHKRRAATPQTARLSAVDIGHTLREPHPSRDRESRKQRYGCWSSTCQAPRYWRHPFCSSV